MSDHELIRRPHQPYMSLPELSGSLTRKRKGEISFETPSSACPILEDPIRPPDHSIVMPELIGICESEPASVPFRHHIRCKSFLRLSVRIQFPESLRGSRCRFPRRPCQLSSPGRSLFR